jgi:superfamily II DNA/RNA helicase
MPFPNEHAARQKDPGGFKDFRRGKPKGFPEGVNAIFGIKEGGGSEIQSIRFAKDKWTVERAKEWLKSNGFKTGVEAAVKKSFWDGVL